MVGPIVGRGEFDDGTTWAMPTPRILIEWSVTDGQRAAGLPFAEAECFHGYRDIRG